MGLNKQKGNMYKAVTHTWNPIKGKCDHNCTYCYMHRIWNNLDSVGGILRLDEKEFKTKLGEDKIIFIGSSTDMWTDYIPQHWIDRILDYIKDYPKNTYLFQTKNPKGFKGWKFYNNDILCITLETNRPITKISNAPKPYDRAIEFMRIDHPRKMVTIEPIMDFDLKPLVQMVRWINPILVNIGADSGGNNLPEPSKAKIGKLIKELSGYTKVNIKPNLKRLL